MLPAPGAGVMYAKAGKKIVNKVIRISEPPFIFLLSPGDFVKIKLSKNFLILQKRGNR